MPISEGKIRELSEMLKEKTSDQRINCHATSLFLDFLKENYSELDNLTVTEFRKIVNDLTEKTLRKEPILE